MTRPDEIRRYTDANGSTHTPEAIRTALLEAMPHPRMPHSSPERIDRR